MREWFHPEWKPLLSAQGLNQFDAIWGLELGWFEEPNKCRGGWSGVSRMDVRTVNGDTRGIFIKRQENHVYKSLMHPLKGEPTSVREFENIKRYHHAGVPTLNVVYFAARNNNGKRQAILITEELSGYKPLDQFITENRPILSEKRNIVAVLAAAIRCLHDHHLQHNCLYPKHIFIKQQENGIDVRLIDLEKTKRRWRRMSACLRDLDTLNRHSPQWSRTDRLRFLLAYMGQTNMDKGAKTLWRRLDKKRKKKSPRT
ncbi:MAG: lipopolysaccharide kinase InaA family protein [Gammaproteobacteria bacterium]|nr:MAG: lipopolysaccharide kinase InaA family protein [Gammaproteobacteria bacterium]